MKVRIVNEDGRGHNTKITNADTGEKLDHCREANIHCTADKIVTVELTFNIPKIDIVGIARLSEKTRKELSELLALLEQIDDTGGVIKNRPLAPDEVPVILKKGDK